MSDVPPLFHHHISEHNRHCWMAAILSLAGAVLGWILFIAFFIACVLLFDVVRSGNPGIERLPDWFRAVLLGVIVALFGWASVDRWMRRFRPVDDRPIIGWHLVADFILMPPRMTFAIWDQLGLRVHLTPAERREAWRLLQVIAERKKAPAAILGQEFSDIAILPRLLEALQLMGWIDIHRGEEDWFYIVRSDAEQELRGIVN